MTWQYTPNCLSVSTPTCAAPTAQAIAPPADPTTASQPSAAASAAAEAVAAAAQAVTAAEKEDQAIAEDWQRLEGVWQRFESLPNGGQLRMEKTIKDHHESLKTFGPDGTLQREQTADLELSRSGEFRILKWSNAVVTAGPGTGGKIANGTAVYVFKAGKWVSTIGLASDEKWGVYTEAWTRVLPDENTK